MVRRAEQERDVAGRVEKAKKWDDNENGCMGFGKGEVEGRRGKERAQGMATVEAVRGVQALVDSLGELG